MRNEKFDKYDWYDVDNYLKSHFDERYSDIAKLFPQFKASQIRDRALKVLKLPPKHKKMKWDSNSIEILKKYYPVCGARYVAELLNQTIYAVNKQAQIQGIKRIYKHYSIQHDGYVVITGDTPYEKVLLHRKIMEEHLQRKLLSTEIVHHIDGNKQNNNISNLQIVTRAEHLKIHHNELQTAKNLKRLEN